MLDLTEYPYYTNPHGRDVLDGETEMSKADETYALMLDALSPADKARHLEADIDGRQVLWDKSGGQGHNWVLADAEAMPADIREEIAAEIIDGNVDECPDYVAKNGQHYRWA